MTSKSLFPRPSHARARSMTLTLLLVLTLFAILPNIASAQDESTAVRTLPLGDHILNLPTPRVLAPGRWEVRFTHRFSQPINEGDVHSLWGLDSAADVGLALAYSPAPRLQLAVSRSDIQDDYELSGKYALLDEADSRPLSLSLRGGVDWRTERNVEERLSLFTQVILSKMISPRIELFAIPGYVSNAGPFDHVFNVPVGAALTLRPTLFAVLELIPPNNDAPSGTRSDVGWAIGLKRVIGGHYFEILLADTRAINVDQYLPGTFLGGIDAGDIHLGFNIERRFGKTRRR